MQENIVMDSQSDNVDAKDDREPFEARYDSFKSDSEKMDQMSLFVSDLLECAQKEAEVRTEAKKAEQHRNSHNRSLFTGLRKGRMLTRARTVVIRMFEAICNCTTTTPPPSVGSSQQHQTRPILQKAHTLAN